MTWTPAKALLLILAAAGTAAAQDLTIAKRRFMEMDANKDGVVTRKEWRGSDQSFRAHDWNRDGVLSGNEVLVGARKPRRSEEPVFETPDEPYEYDDWTKEGFIALDHNRDGRISSDEWHFDREGFRRADHNRDGSISRREFLGEDTSDDDDREDRFAYLDTNRDGRVSRAEWHGTAERFAALDDNRDGMLTRAEITGTTEPPPDLFTSVDVNRDNGISRDEWHWSRGSFDQRDANRDGRLSRQEFEKQQGPARSSAYTAGYERGMTEGRAAGREDRERVNTWDLEGQRELETADSGYEARVGPKAEYQAGYRDGFRKGYREGWGR